jgi:predicted aspartyl protease
MPVYDKSFNPPAPFVSIAIYRPGEPEVVRSVRAKLDTGADISLLPQAIVHALSLRIVSRILTEAYDGTQTVLNAYETALKVEGVDLGRVEMVTLTHDYALLGRDVLNRFVVTLDGPALTFDMQLPRLAEQ